MSAISGQKTVTTAKPGVSAGNSQANALALAAVTHLYLE